MVKNDPILKPRKRVFLKKYFVVFSRIYASGHAQTRVATPHSTILHRSTRSKKNLFFKCQLFFGKYIFKVKNSHFSPKSWKMVIFDDFFEKTGCFCPILTLRHTITHNLTLISSFKALKLRLKGAKSLNSPFSFENGLKMTLFDPILNPR